MGNANIKATVTPLVPQGTGSPLVGSSQSQLRSGQAQKVLGSQTAGALASDLDNIIGQINSIYTLGKIAPTVSQFLLTNAAGQVIAAVGPVTFQGIPYVNYFSEVHCGNPLGTRNPAEALFNANTDGSVTIGQNGWLDVHDPYGGNAAWLGTRNDILAVTGAANNGAGLIRLTVPGHNFVTGNVAQVRNMQYYGVPNALGTWILIVIDASHVDLINSAWAGVFAAPNPLPAGVDTYSPTIDRVLQVIGCVSAGGLIKVQTSVPHLYDTGDKVNIPDIPGVAAATGQWIIKVVDATHFTLNGSAFSGVFITNGTCLRYFAGMLAQTIAIGNSFTDYNLRAYADGTLIIKNAEIIVISGGNSIVLNPAVPDLVFTSASGKTITIDASVPNIVLNAGGGNTITINANTPNQIFHAASGKTITIDASVPSMVFDATGGNTITINANAPSQTFHASSGKTITIDASVPSMVFNATGGNTITINANTPSQVFQSSGGNTITIDASIPDIVVTGAGSITTITNVASTHGILSTAALTMADNATTVTTQIGPGGMVMYNATSGNLFGQLAVSSSDGVLILQNVGLARSGSLSPTVLILTDGTVTSSIFRNQAGINLTGPIGGFTLNVGGSINGTSYSVGGVAGVDLSTNLVTNVANTTAAFGVSLNVGTSNFGTSLTVNTDATGLAGVPGVGQSNITVVTGITLNLGTAVSSVSLNTATAVNTITPTTVAHGFSKGLLTS